MPSPDHSSHAPAHSSYAATIDEIAAHCFGCGAANPHGLHLHFDLDTSSPTHPVAIATITLTELQQGPPGYVHGGIIATLCDEGMSKLNRPLGLLAMTRHMEVDYLRPVPLHTPLTITARHLRREGTRKLFHSVEITLAGGPLLARGSGLFIIIDPSLLAPSPHTGSEA